MLGERQNRLKYLFQSVTGISKEKCTRVFEKHTVEEILDNPLLFEGTAVQTRKIEMLCELQTSMKTKDAFWTAKQISGPQDAIDYFSHTMSGLDHEEVHMLLLNTRHRVIKNEVVSMGGLAGAGVHPREIARIAIKYNAASVILAHNHPSGDPKPSPDDISTTKSIQQALALLGIELIDHLVIGNPTAASLKEYGVFEGRSEYFISEKQETFSENNRAGRRGR